MTHGQDIRLEAARPLPLTPIRATGLLGGFYLLQFAIAVLLGAAAGLSYALQGPTLGAFGRSGLVGTVGPLGAVVGFGCAGLAITACARRYHWPGRDPSPWSREAWRWDAQAATAYGALGALFGLSYVQLVLPAAGSAPAEPLGPLGQMASTPGWPRAAWALLALGLAPWIEEFVFRGVLYGAFESRFGTRIAAVSVATLFTLAHLPEAGAAPPALLAIGILAVLLSESRRRTGGLLAPAALHAGYNASIVGAAWLLH